MIYASILDMPDWSAVGLSALQAAVLYMMVLLCLKLAGRRMFAEMSATDFVVLLMVADAANLGLTHDDGGFWSSVASVATIILMGSTIDLIPGLRHLVESEPRTLYANGRINHKYMKRHHVEIEDLDETARAYGLADHKGFERIVLESDGELTGVVRRARIPRKHGG